MELDVLRIDPDGRHPRRDTVTDEAFLTIHLQGKELLTLVCTPGNEKELSTGFLYSSGLIRSVGDVESISIDRKNMSAHVVLHGENPDIDGLFERVYTSGCGKGVMYYKMNDLTHRKTVESTRSISSETVLHLMKAFEKRSEAFRETGGVHSAALSDGEAITVFREDIGRHNALDKVIGTALYQGIDMSGSVVLTTGRLTSEIMYKVQKMMTPIVVSRSAPTGLSVRLAENWGVTLVGFARGKRMNVYTHDSRIFS